MRKQYKQVKNKYIYNKYKLYVGKNCSFNKIKI